MANNLFVSYDLNAPNKDYERVFEAIKSLGSWAKVHKSVWYVNSLYSAEQANKKIRMAMDSNDSLIVIDVSNNTAAWNGISEVVSKHMKEQWTR